MIKVLSTIFISLTVLLLLSPSQGYADPKNLNFDQLLKIGNEFSFFTREFSGKEKFQLRIKGDNFMIKGVIEEESSSSFTINDKVITLDSSVTGDTKIVGDIKVGAYAMAQGILEDDSLNASKVVVNNRFKDELETEDDEDEDEDEDENLTPTPTTTPTITLTPTPVSTESATIEAETNENLRLDLSKLIEKLQEVLSFLANVVLPI